MPSTSSAAGVLHCTKLAPQERFGAYVLLERIGKGGMAEVHRARLERGNDFRKVVALKRVLPDLAHELEFRARFLEEARTVAELQHPNVVQVFDFGEIDERPYIVMELVDGIDLWRLVGLAQQQGRPIELAAAVYLISEAARGLGYAHSARRDGEPLGIVHRDVSPQNILVSRLGEVKVADFGIAKATNAAADRGCKTTSGAVMGKLRYMSPEQVTGQEVDARTDVFALGVVLHELLTSTQLINAVSPAGVIEQVKAARFDPPSRKNSSVPEGLDAIVMRALAREPSKRYQRAEDLARALVVCLAETHPGYGREELGVFVDSQLAALEARRARTALDQAVTTDSAVEVSEDGIVADRTEHSVEIVTTLSKPRGVVIALETRDLMTDNAPRPVEVALPFPFGEENPPLITRRVSGLRTREIQLARRRRRYVHAGTIGCFVLAGILALQAWPLRESAAMTLPAFIPATVLWQSPLAKVEISKPLPIENPAPLPASAVRAAVAKAPRARRLLDGKPVVFDDQAAPAGEEAAVARARLTYQRAQASLTAERANEAEAGFQRALSEYPGFAPAYRGLGVAYARQGQTDLAISSLRTYVRAAPTAADAPRIRRQIGRLEQGDSLAQLQRDAL